MADTGLSASFSFGGTVYDEDDCVQSWQLNKAINKVIYQCSQMDKAAVGTKVITFAVSLALAATDTAKLAALVEGAKDTFEAHPAGDTATYIEVVAAEAVIEQANMGTGPNNIILLDLVFHLNDITTGAAT